MTCKIVNEVNKWLTPYGYALDLVREKIDTSYSIMIMLCKYQHAIKQEYYTYDDNTLKAIVEYNKTPDTYNRLFDKIDIDIIRNHSLFNLHVRRIENVLDYSKRPIYWTTVKYMFNDYDVNKSIFHYIDSDNMPITNPFAAVCLDEFFIKLDLLGTSTDRLKKYLNCIEVDNY